MVFDWAKRFVLIVFAVFLIGVSVNLFLAPHQIAAGGITGLAIVLEELLNISRSVIIMMGNGILVLMALVFLGKEVFFNTIIGAALLPVVIGILPRYTLVSDAVLSMIIGSALGGAAVAIMYANNASSGGTAIPPLIFKKLFNLNTSVGLFLTDGLVVVSSLLVFSVDSFFFSITSIFISSVTVGYLENGVNRKKMVYVISANHDDIEREVLHTIKRGVTIIPVIGAFKKDEKKMLMVTLNKKDYQMLLTIVNRIDKKAFMITSAVADVHGEGFTYQSGSV